MKSIYILSLVLVTSFASAQTSETKEPEPCEVAENFEEPQRTKKILKIAKRFNKSMDGSFPTIEEIKEQVAIENDVKVEDVTITRMMEQMGNGTYNLCVDGKKMKYKRMGTVMVKNGEKVNMGF